MKILPSLMSLHLRYRLWIAELNSDIDILRIFEDYLAELSSKKDEPQVQNGIDNFHEQFINFRKKIDELRHEMQLLKMKLAANNRAGESLDTTTYQEDNHEALEKQYNSFRNMFNEMKDDFRTFEARWLD